MQERIKIKQPATWANSNNIFRGLMICGGCNTRMVFSSRTGRKSLGHFCCNKHRRYTMAMQANVLKPIRKKFRPSMLLVYALLIFISCICIVPLYWMFRSSLMSNGEIFQYPPLFFPESMRWDNYRKAFESFDAVKYFGNTLKILIPCVLGTVLTSAMAGYALARVKFPGRKVWFALVVCSMILPGHVTLIPQYITYSSSDGQYLLAVLFCGMVWRRALCF
ncbi:MAG: hypothetical protein ACLVJ6_02905 [Merdibacter sp.]